MKSGEPMRWIPTVWKADTEAEAEKKRDRALEADDTIILVREVTTYIPNAYSPDPGQHNEQS